MRVLHITSEFPPVIYGGLGTAVGGLVNASARAGMEVAVLLVGGALVIGGVLRGGYGQPVASPLASDAQEMVVSPEGVTFLQVPWYEAVEPGVHMVLTWCPDVVHLQTHWLWPVARAIQERTGIPLVYTVHSVDRAEYESGGLNADFLSRCNDQEAAIMAASRVIALTRSENELLAQYYPDAIQRVRIVGNGIDDFADARPAARKSRHDKSLLVLYSGRLVERKGIRELLTAIPRVLKRFPATRFVLAGGPGGCSGADLEREWLPQELYPCRGQIHFTGWLSAEEIARWYATADLLVVPSRYEPFGMVVLEGMLHGLAIAAAAVGGPAEILEDGRTGLLFPPNDAEALARAVLRLVGNSRLRQRIGTAAAEEVRHKWLWPRLVEKMHGVYQEALHAGSEKSSPRQIRRRRIANEANHARNPLQPN
jgi:glycogen synthase